MDPIKNPFSPGAGSPPPELVGRESVMQQALLLMGRVSLRRSERSILMTGLRGVGKTVLLNEIQAIAREQGHLTVMMEARENQSMAEVLIPHLRSLILELDRIKGAGDKVKRSLRVLRSFIGSVNVKVGEFTFSIGVDPEVGTADSGDLAFDLPQLLVAVGEAASDRQKLLVLIIDEVQYYSSVELSALIMSLHKIQQERLPLVLVGAGLPTLPGLAGDAKSYAERLFEYPQLGPLSEMDSARAWLDPLRDHGVSIDQEAISELFRMTNGYPYFIQEWGYQMWNCSEGPSVSLLDVNQATSLALPRLDANFFRVRFDRLTPSEKRFLRGMAEIGDGRCRIGELVDVLGVKGVNSIGPVRAKLIQKGMVYSPEYGLLDFTVPLFASFMKRAIPTLNV